MKLKKILNSIWNEFVYGGHLISLGAASIVFTSAILLDIKITWDCLLVVYLGTQSVYLYNHFKEFEKDSLTNPQRSEHIEKYVKYIPLITLFFSLTAIVIVIYFNKILALLFGLLMLFGGLLYSKFLKKFTKSSILSQLGSWILKAASAGKSGSSPTTMKGIPTAQYSLDFNSEAISRFFLKSAKDPTAKCAVAY